MPSELAAIGRSRPSVKLKLRLGIPTKCTIEEPPTSVRPSPNGSGEHAGWSGRDLGLLREPTDGDAMRARTTRLLFAAEEGGVRRVRNRPLGVIAHDSIPCSRSTSGLRRC